MALQAGALSAPLVHAHPDDHHADHHPANAIHAHLDGHAPHSHADASEGRAILAEEAPERAVAMPLFVAEQADTATEPALAESRFGLPSAGDSLMRRRPDDLRSHGPPASPATSPRAPPVSSVLI